MVSQSDYKDPDKYHEHLMQQYLHLCQATQEIMPRREQVNRFFITVIAGLLATLAWVFKEGFATWRDQALGIGLVICVVGIGLCLAWMFKLAMFRCLSAARFQVIQDMEASLPYLLYTWEWRYLQDPAGITHDNHYRQVRFRYLNLTTIERLVPLLLCLPYLVLTYLIIAQLLAPAAAPAGQAFMPVPIPTPAP